MSENNSEINGTIISKKPACSYKSFLGCASLVFILAIFSIAELAIMVGIFIVFMFFYAVIAIFGGIYLLFLVAMKISKHFKERRKNSNKH
ncbi:hypothetical protein fh0823_16380 [Francisella halioticida]|uniref:Uncharacterized protein n=1 Tax=Francisella halioticida TaxID=549298 RepID=A0ABN5AXZ9_9GAMM|nr:hypothetical protein [Francisella halioticida]ASG68595.1 hypothetical protein CDV26_09495 [Francisella halioticida]BCD91499.1 hypothetical protein fh0823_16380 [Francisella halioticida]